MKKIIFAMFLTAGSIALYAQDSTMNNNNNNRMNNSNGTMNNNNGTMNNNSTDKYNNTSTSNYNAYGVPNSVQTSFQKSYPDVTGMTWEQATTDWYRGYYSHNGRYTHVYYSTDPYYMNPYYPERNLGFILALPVTETYIPDEVVTKAGSLYGGTLYDITALKNANKEDVYQVRTIENGQIKTLWINSNGGLITDVYRTDEDMNAMNNNNINTQPATNTNTTNTNTTTVTTTDTNNAAIDNTKTNMDNTKTKIKTKATTTDGKKIITKTKNGKTKTTTNDMHNDKNDQ